MNFWLKCAPSERKTGEYTYGLYDAMWSIYWSIKCRVVNILVDIMLYCWYFNILFLFTSVNAAEPKCLSFGVFIDPFDQHFWLHNIYFKKIKDTKNTYMIYENDQLTKLIKNTKNRDGKACRYCRYICAIFLWLC